MVLTEMAKERHFYAPAGVSVRHLHVCREDLDILFGEGYELHPMRSLVQPGQYAAEETVTLEGPKGRLEHVRIIGPVRAESQAELSLTDAVAIGMKDIPIRLSGMLVGTPGIKVIGPKGEVQLKKGAIAAARHLHLSAQQAKAYKVHDGQVVSVRIAGERPCILEQVVIRCGDGHELEFHVDTDEANACRLQNGDFVQILFPGEETGREQLFDPAKIAGRVVFQMTGKQKQFAVYSCLGQEEPGQIGDQAILDLVTEQDINDAVNRNKGAVFCSAKAIVTPAAADRALARHIEIIRTQQSGGWQSTAFDKDKPVLDLVTAEDLNRAFRDDEKVLYISPNALITPAAKERIAETGIRIVRTGNKEGE